MPVITNMPARIAAGLAGSAEYHALYAKIAEHLKVKDGGSTGFVRALRYALARYGGSTYTPDDLKSSAHWGTAKDLNNWAAVMRSAGGHSIYARRIPDPKDPPPILMVGILEGFENNRSTVSASYKPVEPKTLRGSPVITPVLDEVAFTAPAAAVTTDSDE